mmetsp:Transcript_3153/g.9003  ORF Transcript_3153/g.9003 Transcript_3153/m.9003 type:complete len:227 (+) Transcript_3153:2615-3295(+)
MEIPHHVEREVAAEARELRRVGVRREDARHARRAADEHQREAPRDVVRDEHVVAARPDELPQQEPAVVKGKHVEEDGDAVRGPHAHAARGDVLQLPRLQPLVHLRLLALSHVHRRHEAHLPAHVDERAAQRQVAFRDAAGGLEQWRERLHADERLALLASGLRREEEGRDAADDAYHGEPQKEHQRPHIRHHDRHSAAARSGGGRCCRCCCCCCCAIAAAPAPRPI